MTDVEKDGIRLPTLIVCDNTQNLVPISKEDTGPKAMYEFIVIIIVNSNQLNQIISAINTGFRVYATRNYKNPLQLCEYGAYFGAIIIAYWP